MADIQNQIIALRRKIDLLQNTDVVFNTEPRNPGRNTIWVDTTAQSTKFWNGTSWVITGGNLTDWNMTVVFTATDYRVIAWTSGVVSIGTTTSKTDYATTSGNFTMAATTYFYWQADQPTTIQTTSTAGDVVTAGGVLLAVGRMNSDTANKASLKVFGGPSVDQIIADEIVANSITANMIQANAVTASKLATTLLYAGAITLDTNGHIKGGQTAYNTGTGFFLGYSGAAYKFSIGDSTTNYLTWSGTELAINGNLKTVISLTAGEKITAGAPVRIKGSSARVASSQTSGAGATITYNTGVLGIAINSVSSGQTVNIQTGGVVTSGTYTSGTAYQVDTFSVIHDYLSTYDSTFNAYSGNTIGQTFASTAGDLIGAVAFTSAGSLGNGSGLVSMSLYAVSGGVPTGAALATTITSIAGTSAGPGSFYFDPPYESTGATLAIVMNHTSGDVLNYIQLRYNSTSSYSGGTYIEYSGGSWTSNSGRDTAFRVYTVPQALITGSSTGYVKMGVGIATNQLQLRTYTT